MPIATAAFPESSTRPITRPMVVSIRRNRRVVPTPSNRTWAKYKPPPKWTAFAAFVIAIAMHIAAVAIVHPERDELLTRLWDNRSPALEEPLPENRLE